VSRKNSGVGVVLKKKQQFLCQITPVPSRAHQALEILTKIKKMYPNLVALRVTDFRGFTFIKNERQGGYSTLPQHSINKLFNSKKE
jgi:hypothetical protein